MLLLNSCFLIKIKNSLKIYMTTTNQLFLLLLIKFKMLRLSNNIRMMITYIKYDKICKIMVKIKYLKSITGDPLRQEKASRLTR